MRSLFVWAAALLLPFSVSAEEMLHVGVAISDITPIVEEFEDKNGNEQYDVGEPFVDKNGNNRFDVVWMAGFGGSRAVRTRTARAIHDRLSARAVYLSDGVHSVTLVALDLIGVPGAEILRFKKTLGPNVIIAATHLHSGPDTLGIWGPNRQTTGIDMAYQNFLEGQVKDAVYRARENPIPATVWVGTRDVPGVVRDTRAPDARDETARWIVAQDKTGKTITSIVFFAAHPETLRDKNRSITADYPYFLREKVEDYFGGTAVFFSSDLGGMQTPDVRERTFAEARRVGEAIAEPPERWSSISDPRLSFATKEIDFPLTNERLITAFANGILPTGKPALRVEYGKYLYRSRVSAVRIGGITIAAIPGEAFPEVGKKIFSLMKTRHQFLVGLADDEIGYIVPQNDFDASKYEESMSLGKETEPTLLKALEELLSSP